MLFPEDLDATVIYYGQVTDDEEKLRAINSPILGLFGAEDKGITVESVQLFEAALERLRKNYEIHIYPGADHAFANPSGTAYNAEAADDAWQKTLEFLNLHLVHRVCGGFLILRTCSVQRQIQGLRGVNNGLSLAIRTSVTTNAL